MELRSMSGQLQAGSRQKQMGKVDAIAFKEMRWPASTVQERGAQVHDWQLKEGEWQHSRRASE